MMVPYFLPEREEGVKDRPLRCDASLKPVLPADIAAGKYRCLSIYDYEFGVEDTERAVEK